MIKQHIIAKRLFLTILLVFPYLLHGQCNTWGIVASDITNSTCISNGSFRINLTGTTGSISNIIYYVTGPNTNLNTSSSNFTGLGAGTYIVEAVGLCSGSSTSTEQIIVEIEGGYTKIAIKVQEKRPDPTCASSSNSYGIATITINGGAAPYKINLITTPAGYTGPTEFTANIGENTLNNLPKGAYTFQVTDNCTTTPGGFTITEFNLAAVITNIGLLASDALFDKIEANCFPTAIKSFSITWTPWSYEFTSDEVFMNSLEYTVNTTGTVPSASSYKPFNIKDPENHIPLTPNGTIKDYYTGGSKYFHIFVKFCGTVYTKAMQINPPYISIVPVIGCTDYRIKVGINGAAALCFPLTVTITSSNGYSEVIPVTSYSLNNAPISGNLPSGAYTTKVTSSDGYEYTSASPHQVTGNESAYWVTPQNTIITNYAPLHQRFPRFTISSRRDPAIGNIKVKLTKSPGYYAKYENTFATLADLSREGIKGNQNVDDAHPDYYWKPGDYTFEVSDDCTPVPLVLNITLLESSNAYHDFTLDISDQTITCNGLEVKPIASSVGKPISVLTTVVDVDGQVAAFPFVANGGTITLITPGVYTFAASTREVPIANIAVKIPQMRTEVINYAGSLPSVDLENSQGFACLNETTGQIIVKAIGGTPPLKYELYRTGVKEAENSTGIFDILPKGEEYIVKIIDDCNNAIIQPFKVYDIATIQIVTPNKTAFCEGEDLEFRTFVLPDATYNWTGPNGFTSSEQHPKNTNLTLADAGTYEVVITTPHCGGIPITHSVSIKVSNEISPPPISDINALAIIGSNAKLTLNNATVGIEYTVTDNSLIFISKGVARMSPFIMGLEKIYYEEETNRISITGGASCGNSTSNSPFQVKVKASDITLADPCSHNPKLVIVNLQNSGLTLTWQKKNGVSWVDVGSGAEFLISEAGEYQLQMKKDLSAAVTSDIIKIKLLQKAEISGRPWYNFEIE